MRRGQKTRRTGSDDRNFPLHDGRQNRRQEVPSQRQRFERNILGSPRPGVVTLPANPGASMSDSNIDRRTILSATLAWAAATLSGCSDKASGGTCVGATGADGGVGGDSCGITMTGDHMHPLTICGADVQTPPTDNPTMTKTYTLPDGGTGHIHMVT